MNRLFFSSFLRNAFRHVILFFLVSFPTLSFSTNAFSADTVYFPCPATGEITQSPVNNDDAFMQQLQTFAEEMAMRHNFDRQNLVCLFNRIRHNSRVIDLVKPPAFGTRKNWQAYRAKFMTSPKITAGIQFLRKHRAALEKAEKTYGIPPEIIVGIIGIETNYGRHKGHFRTLDALATLAFDYPEHPKREMRLALFKKELEEVLLLCAKEHIDPFSLKGSYAGAIGWPQFLPSSIRKYAVDFDGDGSIDLGNSPTDAIGSIASFLSQHGWKKGEPLIFPIEVSLDCPTPPEVLLNRKLAAELTAKDLKKICISSGIPSHFPLGLIDLPNGTNPTEYWLGTDNFFVITQYNRSFFYAMSVIELGYAVKTFYENSMDPSDSK